MIVKPRLSLLAGPIAMAVLVASSAWVLWSSFERSKEASRSVERTYNVLIASESFLSSLREGESAVRAYLLIRDRKFLAPYRTALAAQAQKLDELERLTADNPKQQAGLKRIRDLTQQRLAVLAEAEQRTSAGEAEILSSATPPGKGAQLMSEVTAEVRSFESEERQLLAERTNSASEAETWTRLMLILTSGLLAVVLLFGGVAVERYMRNREASLEALQRQADLIDFSHDAVVTVNPDGVITGWNAGAEEVYGWTSAEAVGRSSDEILKNGRRGMEDWRIACQDRTLGWRTDTDHEGWPVEDCGKPVCASTQPGGRPNWRVEYQPRRNAAPEGGRAFEAGGGAAAIGIGRGGTGILGL